MRIPGLGCPGGCLFTLVIMFVAGWLIWELSPRSGLDRHGKGYWEQLKRLVHHRDGLIGDLGGGSGSGGGTSTGN